MRNLLGQLEDGESFLLMYLADELGAEDRAQVEQRIATDPSLAEQLEQLRRVQDSVSESMRRIDAVQPLPGSQAPAVRQVVRQMKQWHAARAAAASRPQPHHRTLQFPYWSYPLAAAAAVTFAFFAWWYNLPEPQPTLVDTGSTQVAPMEMVKVVETPEMLAMLSSLESLEDPRDLTDLEGQLQVLQNLSEVLQ